MYDKPRILLVEDESSIADTVQFALQSNGFDTQWCQTAQDAVARFQEQRPDAVIMDIGLPDMNGFDLFKQLQALPDASATPMLFLTARSDEIDRVVGLELGADDYIAKPFSPRELVARVRMILRRAQGAGAGNTATQAAIEAPSAQQAVVPEATSSYAPFVVREANHQITYYGRLLELSRYEYGILCVLLRRRGRVYSRTELLELVWDEPTEAHDRTVDTHIKTLRAKLVAVAPSLDAIRTVRGMGYALSTEIPTELA